MIVNIREGRLSDCQAILGLIKEHALYEKKPDAVTLTIQQLQDNGFGKDKIFGLFVAEDNGTIVGIAMHYFAYSSWKGKCLFLEDLIVTERWRGKGIGKLLFDKAKEKADDTDCVLMTWQMSTWNERAKNFYDQYKPYYSDNWLDCGIKLK